MDALPTMDPITAMAALPAMDPGTATKTRLPVAADHQVSSDDTAGRHTLTLMMTMMTMILMLELNQMPTSPSV